MSFRLRLTSVSGFPRSWLNIRWPCDTDRLRPRQTGRADFPHPAFPNPLSPRHAQGGTLLGHGPSSHLGQEVESRTGACPSGPPHVSWEQRSGRGPSLHGHYPASTLLLPPPTPGQAERRLFVPVARGSDLAVVSPGRASQVPRSICGRPPSPSTPGSSAAAGARCLAADVRLHQLGKAGHSQIKGFTRPDRVRLRYGWRRRLLRLRRPGYPGRR